MKLLRHEIILGLITILFTAIFTIFSFTYKPDFNVAVGSESAAVPYFININTADIAELETLDGIGPKTAAKIVEYRKEHGSFKNKNELKSVSGIADTTFEKIEDYIEV